MRARGGWKSKRAWDAPVGGLTIGQGCRGRGVPAAASPPTGSPLLYSPALRRVTTGFGMGPGGATALWATGTPRPPRPPRHPLCGWAGVRTGPPDACILGPGCSLCAPGSGAVPALFSGSWCMLSWRTEQRAECCAWTRSGPRLAPRRCPAWGTEPKHRHVACPPRRTGVGARGALAH